MNIKQLQEGKRLLDQIASLKQKKEKVSWYINNQKLNGTTRVGFFTVCVRAIDAFSEFDNSIIDIDIFLNDYSAKITNKIEELEAEFETL